MTEHDQHSDLPRILENVREDARECMVGPERRFIQTGTIMVINFSVRNSKGILGPIRFENDGQPLTDDLPATFIRRMNNKARDMVGLAWRRHAWSCAHGVHGMSGHGVIRVDLLKGVIKDGEHEQEAHRGIPRLLQLDQQESVMGVGPGV